MTNNNEDDKENNIHSKVASAAVGGAVGGLVGGIAGYLAAGPVGAIGGSTLGNMVGNASAPLFERTFQKAAGEFVQRKLGQREEIRVVSVLDHFMTKVKENTEDGQILRQDGFFIADDTDRSPADELFEATLLFAQREFQEKKVRFYGRLLANIVFHPEIDRPQANVLMRLAEHLSYRQLCLLQLFSFNTPHFDPASARTFRDWVVGGELSAPYWSLITEIYELYTQGYLRYSWSIKEALLYPLDLYPESLYLTGATRNLVTLMELEALDQRDLDEVGTLLRGPAAE